MSSRAQIDVDHTSGNTYHVVIDDFTSASDHEVTLQNETYERLSRGRSQADFIRDAVRFLLTKEPKESILEIFDIEDIKKYYSEFEQEI